MQVRDVFPLLRLRGLHQREHGGVLPAGRAGAASGGTVTSEVTAWAYDEEDYPALVVKIVDAVHRLSAGGTRPVDAAPVPESLSPDFYAVVIADHPLDAAAVAAAWAESS